MDSLGSQEIGMEGAYDIVKEIYYALSRGVNSLDTEAINTISTDIRRCCDCLAEISDLDAPEGERRDLQRKVRQVCGRDIARKYWDCGAGYVLRGPMRPLRKAALIPCLTAAELQYAYYVFLDSMFGKDEE